MQFVRRKLEMAITQSIFLQIEKLTPQNWISRRARFNGQGPKLQKNKFLEPKNGEIGQPKMVFYQYSIFKIPSFSSNMSGPHARPTSNSNSSTSNMKRTNILWNFLSKSPKNTSDKWNLGLLGSQICLKCCPYKVPLQHTQVNLVFDIYMNFEIFFHPCI